MGRPYGWSVEVARPGQRESSCERCRSGRPWTTGVKSAMISPRNPPSAAISLRRRPIDISGSRWSLPLTG